jgi:isopenicillin N synthase-like dioxygenase
MADNIPIVDLAGLDGTGATRMAVAGQVAAALTHHGFMYVSGLPLWPLVEPTFRAAREFFERDANVKLRSRYTDISDNFGYQAVEVESLDPASPPDLKETFTMRNAAALAAGDARWPDDAFRDTAQRFYGAALQSAHVLLGIMATALELPPDFFAGLHRGENVTLRYLHYPTNLSHRERQLGAGEHTDYGSITLLFQDDVGGLEVRGRDGKWIPAPPIAGCAVINTGDLMQRWTNERFCSTPHRVRPVTGARDRYSIAMFVDPDPAVEVRTLPSCITPERPARYPPISAAAHLQQRIAATHLAPKS